MLIIITIIASAIASSIVINENYWQRTEKIAHFHGKIDTSMKIIDIDLGNLSCGECFETKEYRITIPLYQTENISIWLGDIDRCSFGIFNHFYLKGYLIDPEGQKIKNISADLAHSEIQISYCEPGSTLVFTIQGQVGYPKYPDKISLDDLYLVMHQET